MAPPDTAKLLEQERRLMKPAGYIALLGVLLFIASIFLQSSAGGEDLDTSAGLLRNYSENGSTLMVSRVLFSLAFLCFAPALYVLFKAAQARIPNRIRPAMVAFCFIGPVLLAIQAPILAVGLRDAGDQFVDEEPALEREAAAEEAAGGEESAGSGGESGSAQGGQGGQDRPSGSQGGDTPTSSEDGEVTTTPTEEGTADGAEESDSEEDPLEERADELLDDNGTVGFARALLLPALIGMVAAMVYIPLWAMRTGLLTRFMASFGMALGVSLLILPFAQIAVVFWFGVLGLIYLDRWLGNRPPAWEEGRAIPWQRPGDQPPDDQGPIEGSGRDVSGGDPAAGDDPGAGPPGDNGASGDNGAGGGPSPRKRKRRR